MNDRTELKIFITGGLGFVGRHLCSGLLQDGHKVTAVGRTQRPPDIFQNRAFTYLAADTTQKGVWQDSAADSDVVINLAGKSIFTLWTDKTKQKIRSSRIATTRNLAETLSTSTNGLLISASAVGYYGERGDDILTETEPAGEDFLSDVAVNWEKEAFEAASEHIRVVTTRFGIVLGSAGGAMKIMLPLFRWYLGGRLGGGEQWFPWIHVEDILAAYRFLINHPEIKGPINCCAPEPVRNRELTALLAEKLHRPAVLNMPAPVINAIMGDLGKALLCSIRAHPAILTDAGFIFEFPDLHSALDRILSKE